MPRTALRVLQVTITAMLLTATVTAAESDAAERSGRAAGGDEVGPSRPVADASTLSTSRWFPAIHEVRADITIPPEEATPPDQSGQLVPGTVDGPEAYYRQWPDCCFMWAPTDLCYWPLYFEDVQLERYGQTLAPRFQPLLSGAHFYASFCLLPASMVIDRPFCCVYTLGYRRPGSRVPCRRHPDPAVSVRAAGVPAREVPASPHIQPDLERLPPVE